MEQAFRSCVWRLGDNIDTDIIIMTKYLAKASLQEMVPISSSPCGRTWQPSCGRGTPSWPERTSAAAPPGRWRPPS